MIDNQLSTNINLQNERNPTFDMMKGIGIICVIIGHLSDYFTTFIFSFHMPLFFIISGYFFYQQPSQHLIKKDFNRFIVPYIFTSLIILIYWIIRGFIKDDLNLPKYLLTIIYGNGSTNHTSLYFSDIPTIGAIWFLPAIFWCKTIFNYIHRYTTDLQLFSLCVIISILAIYIDKAVINLPFAILPGFGALIFYFIGYKINDFGGFNKIPIWLIVLLGIIWVVSFMFYEMSMVRCYYQNLFICMSGAVGGTIIIYLLCTIINNYNKKQTCNTTKINYLMQKFNVIGVAIAYIFKATGLYSLAILCAHLIDLHMPFRVFFNLSHGWQAIIFDFIFCFLLVLTIKKFKLTRKIFAIA